MTIETEKIKLFFKILIFQFLIIRPRSFIFINESNVYVFCALQLLLTLYLLFINRYILRVGWFQLLTILYYAYAIINTIIHNGAVPGTIQTAIWGICTVFLLEYEQNEFGTQKFLDYSCYGIIFLLLVNYLSIIFFPDGIVTETKRKYVTVAVSFLGESNQYTIVLFLAGALLLYRILILKNSSHLFNGFAIALIALTVLTRSSATCKIAFIILVIGVTIYLILPKLNALHLSPLRSVVLAVVIFLLLTKILTLDFVSNFIVDVLGKDVTLSERTTIWASAYSMLQDLGVLLFGKGEVAGGAYITIYTGNTFSAHNIILQILLSGGIVMLSFFVGIVGGIIVQSRNITDKNCLAVLSISFFAFLLINMTEVFEMPVVLACLYYFYLMIKANENIIPLEEVQKL